MSDYEDAIDNLDIASTSMATSEGLRHRTSVPHWDPDDISLSSEVPGLHEVKVHA